MGQITNSQISAFGSLSETEAQVAKFLSEHLSDDQIGERLNMSFGDVGELVDDIASAIGIVGNNARQAIGRLYDEFVNVRDSQTDETAAKPETPVELSAHRIDFDQIAHRIGDLSSSHKHVLELFAGGASIGEIATNLEQSNAVVAMTLGRISSRVGLPLALGDYKLQYLRIAGQWGNGEYEKALAMLEPILADSLEAILTYVPPEEPEESGTSRAKDRHKLPQDLIERLAAKMPMLQKQQLATLKAVATSDHPEKVLGKPILSVNSALSTIIRRLGIGSQLRKGLRRKAVIAAYLHFINPPQEAEALAEAAARSEVETESLPQLPATTLQNGHDKGARREKSPAAHEGAPSLSYYGPGVPINLADPQSIADVAMISGKSGSKHFAPQIAQLSAQGFTPETLIVYPTADPSVSVGHIVLIKRKS